MHTQKRRLPFPLAITGIYQIAPKKHAENGEQLINTKEGAWAENQPIFNTNREDTQTTPEQTETLKHAKTS